MLLDLFKRKKKAADPARLSLVTIPNGPFKGRMYAINDKGKLGRRYLLEEQNGEKTAVPANRRLRFVKIRMTEAYRKYQSRTTCDRQRAAVMATDPTEVWHRLHNTMNARREARTFRRASRSIAA